VCPLASYLGYRSRTYKSIYSIHFTRTSRYEELISAVSSGEPHVARAADARSRSANTSGSFQRPPGTSLPWISASSHSPCESVAVESPPSSTAVGANVARDNKDTATNATNTAGRNSEKKVEEGSATAATEGVSVESLEVEGGVGADVGVGVDSESMELTDMAAAEADMGVDGVATDRVRTLSSTHRLVEGPKSQHHQQEHSRLREASRTVAVSAACQEKEKTDIEGAPPELVVSEDQEVCGLVLGNGRNEEYTHGGWYHSSGGKRGHHRRRLGAVLDENRSECTAVDHKATCWRHERGVSRTLVHASIKREQGFVARYSLIGQ